jgi:hypothetical protein
MKRILVLSVSVISLFASCVSSRPTYTKSISANGDVVISNIAYRKKLNVPLAILTNLAIGVATSQIKLEDENTGVKKKIGISGGASLAITSGLLTYFIGRGYRASTWEVTDNTWQSWWAKVNKKENFQTTYVEFNHNGTNISSVNFFSPANSDRFRIFTEKDVRTYNAFLKNKIDINTVIAKSYSQMDEYAITAIVKEYPNNKYINQLKERYTTLVTIRKRAEQREYESAAAVVNLFGGIAKNLVTEAKDAIQNIDFSTPSNSTNSNSTSTKSSKTKDDCLVENVPSYKEIFDGVKDNWIKKYDQYSIKFDDGKKGEIVYWQDEKRWSIYAPAGFSFRNDYQDYNSKSEAINALYEWAKCGIISKKGKK